MASLQKRTAGGKFYAFFRDEHGRRTCRCTNTNIRADAMKIALDWERAAQDARRGALTVDKARRVLNDMLALTGQGIDKENLKDFATRWLQSKERLKASTTAQRYGPIVRRFVSRMGTKADLPLSAIAPADVERHRDALIAEGKSPGSVRLELKTLRSLFNHAVRQSVILSNPFNAVEMDEAVGTIKEPFTPEEVTRLLQASAGTDWQGAILLASLTGLRLSDVANLDWSAVDLVAQTVSLRPRKTSRKGNHLILPLHESIVDHLGEVAERNGSQGAVFPTLVRRTGGRNGLSGRFNRLMDKAGIVRECTVARGAGRRVSSKSFHSLRHYTATELLNAGVDEALRMKLTGHATAQMNRRYSHATVESLRAAVAKLPAPSPQKSK